MINRIAKAHMKRVVAQDRINDLNLMMTSNAIEIWRITVAGGNQRAIELSEDIVRNTLAMERAGATVEFNQANRSCVIRDGDHVRSFYEDQSA
ncbi:MAG: hypothetical protein NDI61_09230 [Bdellovibrionaceae bacterium]|nr:hypothetical protein [Pseudobdellovibrionaceae bacterium]